MENISYVTFDRATGALTGAYDQVPPESHVDRIEVPGDVRANWTSFRANASFDGVEPMPALPPALPTVPDYVAAVQSRLDTFARMRNYDGILSACTYAASAVPRFAAEGAYAVTARDSTWAKCYDLMDQVQAGTIPQPTLEQFAAMLPALEWPA